MKRWRSAVVGLVVGAVATAGRADADSRDGEFPQGALAGPVLGISWGKGVAPHLTGGVEAGVAFNILLHLNAGVTWRNEELFAYTELDGWFYLGATAGVGYGTSSEWQPVLGLWEALPYEMEEGCDDVEMMVMSAGYRWTGLHEFYVAGKYGRSETLCFE